MERKIVVIGMDNTGKTTLANQLAHDFGCEHIKSPGPGYSREEMMEELIRELELPDLTILERFSILEELVYGNVLRNHSKFNYSDLELIRKYNPLFIYCRPSDEDVYNFGDREQMKGVIEEKEKLLKAWDNLIKRLKKDGYDVIKYNWRTATDKDQLRIYSNYYGKEN